MRHDCSRARLRGDRRLGDCGGGRGGDLVHHRGRLSLSKPQAKKLCALCKASASRSTSSKVLYMPKEARQVAVVPKRASSGCAQWVPARTATPSRSMIVEMSCGWAPSRLKLMI